MECLGYKLTTDQSSEPVTASEMREYLRLDDTAFDDLLSSLVAGARSHLEETTGRILGESTIKVQFEDFDDESTYPQLVLPVTPVSAIVSIKYDIAGVETTLAASQYDLRDYSLFPVVVPAYGVSWPIADDGTVIVEITAGMTSTDAIFKRGCAIIKALVADMFEHPEASIEKSLSENKTIERLMAGFRTR